MLRTSRRTPACAHDAARKARLKNGSSGRRLPHCERDDSRPRYRSTHQRGTCSGSNEAQQSVITDSAGGRRADAVTNKLQHGMGCVHGSWTRLRQICVPAAQLQSDREGGKLELPLLNLSSGSERRVCARGPAQYAWNSEAGGRCKGKSERAARVAEHSPRRQSGLR